MKYEEIEKLIQKPEAKNPVEISFRKRARIKGVFIKTADYNELSRKNLWRIVTETKLGDYKASKDESLARIFNGAEFTKLSLSPQ